MSEEQTGRTPQGGQPQATTDTDAEHERRLREQLQQVRVVDLAYEMMVGLVTLGYQRLGLTEQTRDLRDLGEAHMAIELLRATLEVVEREHGAEPFRDVRSTLAQMQLGYVQALPAPADEGRAGAAQGASGERPADASAR
jgi:hypothetical protein